MTMPILEISKLRKSFGGLLALSDVSFAAQRDEITAIIGPNGAGKTTLFNLVAGTSHPTSGEVRFEGRVLNGTPSHDRVRMGIARTFQSVELFGNMSVLENAMMGLYTRSSAGFLHAALRAPRHWRDERLTLKEAMATLKLVGLDDRSALPALSLPFGQQRLLALARALATKPRLLMLDEPGAGLNSREKMDLANLVCRLRDGGITILLVEHDMDLVMGIADHIIVLDHGEKIAEGTAAEVQSDERVIAAYLGTDDDWLTASAEPLAVGAR